MPTRTLLTDQALAQALTTLPNWHLEGGALTRTYTFGAFAEAVAFIVRVGFISERLDHHADITNSYTSVTLRVSTHTPKGLTELDIAFASEVDKI